MSTDKYMKCLHEHPLSQNDSIFTFIDIRYLFTLQVIDFMILISDFLQNLNTKTISFKSRDCIFIVW